MFKYWRTVIRVWEDPPPEAEEPSPAGQEPLDWILLTSLPTRTPEAAWERVEWERQRWIVAASPHGRTTGCRIEARPVQSAARLIRVLGVLSRLAGRVLHRRDHSRHEPDRPAHEVVVPHTVVVLAARTGQSPAPMTVGAFWTEVARLGGYLARRRDGPPGWKPLWKGWLQLHTLREGVQLAAHLRNEPAAWFQRCHHPLERLFGSRHVDEHQPGVDQSK